jgi:hypothetical protein|uniref:Uncharacterized protein n=1 Tax=Eutreptiella gymnastica TaxID=73025 RepID=A0A7S4CW72_9EUGL|eukprot:CAMPEP_0174302698 /NCGR_PEP_ID=MMETSP0809-20121228/59764_1 /TAXON_ID=73025 ORGANISM="Eutreptiella gymnastica-like, Strain CCMP1594" /NCGR_SAMPLE_ID=MMETSP0809 /ASSEMBLY_ACC=CAM_ASM_000658 /LENGTH=237 /DNA_ID=CAMNT_0015408619 /DNA_START=31 /DNA_END=744 /DNA_ORIENTATION=-
MAQIFVDIWVEGKRWRLPEGERFNLAPFMDQAVEGNGRFTLQDTQDRCRMALDSDCKIWVQGQHRYKVVPVKIEPSAPRGSKDGAATGKSLYMQTEKEAIKASRPDGVHYASHAHECWNKLDQKMKDAWEKRAEESNAVKSENVETSPRELAAQSNKRDATAAAVKPKAPAAKKPKPATTPAKSLPAKAPAATHAAHDAQKGHAADSVKKAPVSKKAPHPTKVSGVISGDELSSEDD